MRDERVRRDAFRGQRQRLQRRVELSNPVLCEETNEVESTDGELAR